MAEPTDSYPAEATHGARTDDADGEGEAGVRAVLDAHGEDLAAALDRTDEAADVVETAVLVLASATDEEVDHVTESVGNLVAAADGLSTEAAAALAADVGAHGDDLADALETVLALQRAGHLEDFATVATAFSESLSPDEVEELATLLEESGDETVEALDTVLDLQREGHVEGLVALASALSALEVDDDAADGLNAVLGAVGDATRETEPVGLVGFVAGLRSRDARAGLGFLLSLLRAQGRRVRGR